MKNIFAVLLFICCLSTIVVHGQFLTQNAHFKLGDVELIKFLNKNFSVDDDRKHWPGCTVSVLFVKFRIDTIGNIIDITYSRYGDCPEIFKLNLEKTILATNGMWTPANENGKAVKSKPFILPFVCDLEAGCGISKDGKRTYKPLRNNSLLAIEQFLYFGDSAQHEYQLDCIILEPLRVFSIE